MKARNLLYTMFVCLAAAAGTLQAQSPQLVKDINFLPEEMHARNFVVSGSQVFFTAWTPEAGDELWRSDGTAGPCADRPTAPHRGRGGPS